MENYIRSIKIKLELSHLLFMHNRHIKVIYFLSLSYRFRNIRILLKLR